MTMSNAEIFVWVFSFLTGCILLTWLNNSSKTSIFICAVFHSKIDIAFTADLANRNIINYTGILIYRCTNVIRALKKMAASKANLIRNGILIQVATEDSISIIILKYSRAGFSQMY